MDPAKGSPCHKVVFIYLFICLPVFLFICKDGGVMRKYGVQEGRDNLLCRILAL